MHHHLFCAQLHVSQDEECFKIYAFSGAVSYGAWINIDAQLNMSYHQFSAAQYQGKIEKPRPSMPIHGGWY